MKLDLDLTENEWKFLGWCIILGMSIITGEGIGKSLMYISLAEMDIDRKSFNGKLDPIFDLIDKSESLKVN